MAVFSRDKKLTLMGIARVLLLLGAFLAVGLSFEGRRNRRIRSVVVHVRSLRMVLENFVVIEDRYPHSLAEFREYHARGGNLFWEEMYVDLTSGKQRDVPEYRELNDKGGYYYDPNVGEVRLNLTRPVKSYLLWYRGEWADHVPANW